MKFCDEKIQKHLLNGGKIIRLGLYYPLFFHNDGIVSYKTENNKLMEYGLVKEDLTTDNWEIVEPEYDWGKIIKDEVLCVFSDEIDYKTFVISTLVRINDNGFSFSTNEELSYGYCKPFNPADFNIAKDFKEYER